MTLDRGTSAGDGRRMGAGRPALLATAAALVVGVVLGAILGALAGKSRQPSYDATAAISVQPDVTLAADLNSSSSTPQQDATDFIQSELLVLNGPALARSVQQALSLQQRPQLSSKQVGQTYIVDVTGTASTRSQALAITREATNQFSQQYRANLVHDYNSALSAVESQIAVVRARLAGLSSSPTTVLAAEHSALEADYERLLGVDSTLLLSRVQTAQAVSTVQAAALSDSGLSATTKLAVAGGVLGGFVALALILLLRQFRPRLSGAAEANELGIPVLLPELTREGAGLLRRSDRVPISQDTRLLAARAVAHHKPGDGPLVVIGSEHGAGSTFVAAQIARELASQGPVVLLVVSGAGAGGPAQRALGIRPGAPNLVADVGEGDKPDLKMLAAPTLLPGVWAVLGGSEADLAQLEKLARDGVLATLLSGASRVVVDAPPLSASRIGLSLAGTSGAAILVCARSFSRREVVVSAVEIIEASETPLVGVVLNSPRRSWGRSRPAAAPRGPVETVPVTAAATFAPDANDAPEPKVAPGPKPKPAARSAAARRKPAARRPTRTTTLQGGKSVGRGSARAPDQAPS
jgi:Mrp family chromosome partitioning ATPase